MVLVMSFKILLLRNDLNHKIQGVGELLGGMDSKT